MHSRDKKSSSTPQNTNPSFPNQQTLTSKMFSPTHWDKAPQKKTKTKNKQTNKQNKPQTTRIRKGHHKHSNLNRTKSQTNTQQVKEHETCLPSQIKEEEKGNIHEKEFRIMLIKMNKKS